MKEKQGKSHKKKSDHYKHEKSVALSKKSVNSSTVQILLPEPTPKDLPETIIMPIMPSVKDIEQPKEVQV
jgi:hypothetical protein